MSELKLKKEELGLLLVGVYWAHDAMNFNELKVIVANIYNIIGYKKETSEKAAALVADAYAISDQAETERRKGNLEKEKSLYQEIFNKFLCIEKLLNINVEVAKFQIKWWVNFRHKNLALAALFLLLQHVKAFQIIRFHESIITSYYLIKVGFAHNKRDEKQAVKYASKYWKNILKLPKERIPFIG